MANRAEDWVRQAERDLEMAEEAAGSDRHEWACFASQQAAEGAVTGLHRSLGQEAWGHVVARLLRELPESVAAPAELVEQAKFLDNAYIPARYPNSPPEGAPFEHFGPLQSKECLAYARAIVAFVRAQMA